MDFLLKKWLISERIHRNALACPGLTTPMLLSLLQIFLINTPCNVCKYTVFTLDNKQEISFPSPYLLACYCTGVPTSMLKTKHGEQETPITAIDYIVLKGAVILLLRFRTQGDIAEVPNSAGV